ncbi:hypothetical protein SUGI_0592650 [Cryptomeria japonica]|nr:hypothetical protein SUGI_0592650 [Cryptomeria japonica]
MKLCERVEGVPEQGVGSLRCCITSLPSDQESTDFFLLEKLLAQDDTKHSCTICMTDTDLPGFIGYEATFEFSEWEEEGNCLMK